MVSELKMAKRFLIFGLIFVFVLPLMLPKNNLIFAVNQSINIADSSNSNNTFRITQPIDISSISLFDDVMPSIALDHNGNVHITFYDKDNYIIYYANSITNYSLMSIASGAGFEYEKPKIFIDSHDVVHIIYAICVGVGRTLWYINNSGGNFVKHINITQINGIKADYGNFDAVIDPNDYIHIVVDDSSITGTDEIFYFNIHNGHISPYENVSIHSSKYNECPRIDYNNGIIFTTWLWYAGVAGAEIMVSYKLPGLSWSTPYNITRTPGMSYLEMMPEVALDYSGNYHIFYINMSIPSHLTYFTDINGTPTCEDFTFTWQTSPYARIYADTDSNSIIHGFWYDSLHDSDNEIYYITNINGSFNYFNITKNNVYDSMPQFVIGPDNNIYLTYESNITGNLDIYFLKIIYNESKTQAHLSSTPTIPGFNVYLSIFSLTLIALFYLINKFKPKYLKIQ